MTRERSKQKPGSARADKKNIHFGQYALRCYAKGRPLHDCVPPSESDDWITLDTITKTLDIYLR